MRLLQLNSNGNDSSAIDLHPMVTVVTGLSDSGRARVIQAITALPTGDDPGCRGLLEAHGILLDLTRETLSMLDLASDLDVRIGRDNIPGGQSSGPTTATPGITLGGKPLTSGPVVADEPAPASSGTGSVLPRSIVALSADDFLAITPEGEYPELDRRRLEQAQAAEALGIFKEAYQGARAAHEEAKVRTRVAEVALDQVLHSSPRANLRLVTDEFEPDEFEVEGLDDEAFDATRPGGLTDTFSSFRSVGSAIGDEDDDTRTEEEALRELAAERDRLVIRKEELQALIAKVDRGIDELAALDPRPIQVLLDAIQNPPPVEMGPSARAHELAEDFVRLQGEVQTLEESLGERGLGSASAMSRLEEARTALAAAEKANRPPEFTDADRSELEAAHEETLDASNARGRGGKKRLEEAMAKEQLILDRMGFPTWSAYVMGSTLMGIDPAAEQRLDQARFEFESAEAHWSDVAAMIEADPVHRETLDKLEAVYLEAIDLLGGDDELTPLDVRLRNHLEPKRDVSIDELVEALAYQLELVGIGLPAGSASLDRTVMVATAFMEEASAITGRLNELGSEKVESLTELQGIEANLDALPTDEQVSERINDRIARLEREDAERAAGIAEAEIAAQTAERRRVANEAAAVEAAAAEARSEEDRLALERELEIAIEEEGEYLDLVDARQALLDHAIQAESIATSQVKKRAAELAQAATEQGIGTFIEPDPLRDATPVAVPTPPARIDDSARLDLLVDGQGGTEAIEFYLLARLAALRSASFAGSVPLVIDDALVGLPDGEVDRLLYKLERMSESVQIVYLTDDGTVTKWAESVGFERAAVVSGSAAFS